MIFLIFLKNEVETLGKGKEDSEVGCNFFFLMMVGGGFLVKNNNFVFQDTSLRKTMIHDKQKHGSFQAHLIGCI